MPTLLKVLELNPSLLHLVRGCDYGSESYHRELATWLETEADEAMTRGTRIWAYATPDGEIAGYSSLGTTLWAYPEPNAKKVQLTVIPAVALRREFWGKPEGADRDSRFSSQIMRHLLTEAANWKGNIPAVGLYVHPENRAAIHLYERFGFIRFHTKYLDATTGTTYLGYVRALPRGNDPGS